MSLQNRAHHIVVLGAGYGGLPCALRLGRAIKSGSGSATHVTLVSKEARQELTCELYRTLRTGNPESFPFAKLAQRAGVRFIEGTVHEINPMGQKLQIRGERALELPYDTLVVASGGKAVQPNIEGLEGYLAPSGVADQRVFPFRNNLQVQALRLALRRLGWGSSTQGSDDLFVVVLGAGATGIEVAGELAHLRGRNTNCRVVLVDSHSELLPEFSPIARRILKRELHRRKIETILGSPAVRATDRELHIANGQVIPWDLMVVCTGTRPPSLLKSFGASLGAHGLSVGPRLEVKGHPNHYAIGDALHSNTLSKRAQFAVEEGRFVADLLETKILKGRSVTDRSFEPTDWGYLVSLGPYSGVGRLGPELKNPLGRLVSPFLAGPAVDSMKRLARVKYLSQLRWG